MSNLLTFWTKKGKFYIVALSAGLPQPAASRSQQPRKQPQPAADDCIQSQPAVADDCIQQTTAAIRQQTTA